MSSNEIYLYSNVNAALLYVETDSPLKNVFIDNKPVQPLYTKELPDQQQQSVFSAADLSLWSLDHPNLHTFSADGIDSFRFGHCELKTVDYSKHVLFNEAPVYLRGYIRGIIAHEHPNLEALDPLEFYRKNIRQAKRFGFNLVRFHSTIPDEKFVQAADELGLFIHAEIGFAYDYGKEGKKNLSMDNKAWIETIKKYRNHPSLAIFCIGNEMHNAGKIPQVRALYDQGKKLASHKMIMDNSGWGEYDRSSADIFAQHIAYFFPYKHHRDMFIQDDCWHKNGSISGLPMSQEHQYRRFANPLRPTLAHEALHYIDIIDYKKLEQKFKEKVRMDIKQPRFLTEIPKLIKRKGLDRKFPDYIAASQQFRRLCTKIYLERLRLSTLAGFEMLQFADCYKYENRNGIVDCFDDDRIFTPEWMSRINANTVLLIDTPEESFAVGQSVQIPVYLSHFAKPINTIGDLTVYLNDKELFKIPQITTIAGLQKLADIEFKIQEGKQTLRVTFTTKEKIYENSWDFWGYPETSKIQFPDDIQFTQVLNDSVLEQLKQGQTILLNYHRDNKENQYYWPGTLDRFKPCIWDRGSNLGGIINEPWLEKVFGEKYFNLNAQPLVEGAYKLNLDHFPGKGHEFINGVDKPVRDRMKGLVQNIKDFIDDDTLRNFCYLFGIKVGAGTLFVSTFQMNNSLISKNYHQLLAETLPSIKITESIEFDKLKSYLEQSTKAGVIKEDTMNHFWEIDNKMVEDTLFWEASGLDLSKIK